MKETFIKVRPSYFFQESEKLHGDRAKCFMPMRQT